MTNTPAKRFLERFVNNNSVYALQTTTGAYFPKRGSEITNPVFAKHLTGELTLGIYSTNPEDNTARWLCWDFDNEQEEGVSKISNWLSSRGFPSYRESIRPGRSGHLWIFFDRAIPSECAYRLGFHARFVAGVSCEIYPKQDRLREGQLGNLVRMPLGVHRKVSAGGVRGLFQGCTSQDIVEQLMWFIDQPAANSEAILNLVYSLPLPQNPRKKVKRAKKGNFGDLVDEFPEDWPWQERAGGELVGLCPKCWEEGHDKQENNLSLNTERNILRCHYEQGVHTFVEIMEALRNYKKSEL